MTEPFDLWLNHSTKNFNTLALAWSAKTWLGDAGSTVESPFNNDHAPPKISHPLYENQ